MSRYARPLLAALLLGLGGLLPVRAGTTWADPGGSQSPGASAVPFTCDNGVTGVVFQVGTQSDHSQAVKTGHILDTTTVFINRSINFTTTDNGTVVDSTTVTHAATAQDQKPLVTCTAIISFVDPGTGDLIVTTVTATGFITPR
jgi:hypothetical protein